MRIEAWNVPTGQPLADDYWHRFERTGGLYEENPRDPASWERRAAWLDNEDRPRADRRALAEALLAFNERYGCSPETARHIGLLGDSGALCVVGGQQAGLFTGPLLVIYKALTIIRTAKEASEKLGRPVVPVFWIAGEDHDFDEANHIFTLTPELQAERIRLEHPTGGREAVSQLKLRPEQWLDALDRLDAALLPTEFKPGLLEKLKQFAAQSETLVDYFACMMSWLFGHEGLVLIDSGDPAIRKLESPLFRRLIERNEELAAALLEGKNRLEAAGYEPQADVPENGANLFVIDGGDRILLYRSGREAFADRKGERTYGAAQLLDWAETAPERLSNNVMTRPLMQDYLFPVLAAVLGPSEIAYWGLTREAFRSFGLRMPILLPRTGFTIVEGTIQKNMQKYGLSAEDALLRLEQRRDEWLQSQDTLRFGERFAEVREQFARWYEPILADLSGVNPGLGKLGATNRDKIVEQIRFLENKAEEATKAQFEAALRQYKRIGMSLAPEGKPQERFYNVTAYLNKYGEAWLKQLADAPTDGESLHYICYM